MLNDESRNNAYFSALESAIAPGSHVFEIGNGFGSLATMAAKLGSERVITCEAEPLVVATATRIVSEYGYDTDAAWARNPRGRERHGCPVRGKQHWPISARREFLRLQPAAFQYDRPPVAPDRQERPGCRFDERRHRGIPLRIRMDSIFPGQARVLHIPVKSPGRCHGVLQWLRLQMDPSLVFENHPSNRTQGSDWQLCAFAFPQPVEIEPGQVAAIAASHNQSVLWFDLDGIS